MRPNSHYEVTDPLVVRSLIDANPWATLVSDSGDGLVASHYPVLLDDASDELAVLTHVGRPDEELHRFGSEQNLQVLTRLVERFERHVEAPVALDQELGAQLAAHTVGLRMAITRFVCKVKMSQDKDAQSQRQVLDALRAPGPYFNPTLAEQMQQVMSAAPARSE